MALDLSSHQVERACARVCVFYAPRLIKRAPQLVKTQPSRAHRPATSVGHRVVERVAGGQFCFLDVLQFRRQLPWLLGRVPAAAEDISYRVGESRDVDGGMGAIWR